MVERFQRGADGAAAFVAQHQDERSVQVVRGVLDRPEDRVVDHVARDPDHEQVRMHEPHRDVSGVLFKGSGAS